MARSRRREGGEVGCEGRIPCAGAQETVMQASTWLVAAGIGLAALSPLNAQEFRPKGSGIPAAEVDKAIQKGLGWLKGVPPRSGVPTSRSDDTNELVLYTLLHGGLGVSDPVLADY